MRLLTYTIALAQSIAVLGAEPSRKLENLLMLPEPRAMRIPLSTAPEGAKLTVLTPARESASNPGKIEIYTKETFKALGLSLDTFFNEQPLLRINALRHSKRNSSVTIKDVCSTPFTAVNPNSSPPCFSLHPYRRFSNPSLARRSGLRCPIVTPSISFLLNLQRSSNSLRTWLNAFRATHLQRAPRFFR